MFYDLQSGQGELMSHVENVKHIILCRFYIQVLNELDDKFVNLNLHHALVASYVLFLHI